MSRNFVLISTDKAVDPVNVLGASKRLAEMVCQALLADGPTCLVIVRFGNVLDSAGSVVPLFREQIARGGPVTVTHPEITRYFMTIPEACQLILQTTNLSHVHRLGLHAGHGRAVAIRELAEQMIRLAGKQSGTRHRHRVHRPAAGREAARNPVPSRRAPCAHGQSASPALRTSGGGAVAMNKITGSSPRNCSRTALDDQVFRDFLRETVHDYRPAGANVIQHFQSQQGEHPSMSFRIRKAVFPVAGLGTRFLPATKTVPKEMLPIIDKPLIQYAVDEAIEAGCDTLVFVTNRYKHAVADYFDKAYELEQKLEKAGKSELLSLIRRRAAAPRARRIRDPGRGAGIGPCGAVRQAGGRQRAIRRAAARRPDLEPRTRRPHADGGAGGARVGQRDRRPGCSARPDRQLRHRRHTGVQPTVTATFRRSSRNPSPRSRRARWPWSAATS